MSDKSSEAKPSQIAAAQLKVAIADRTGVEIPNWIRELASRNLGSSPGFIPRASGDQDTSTSSGAATDTRGGHEGSNRARDRLNDAADPLEAHDSQGVAFEVPELSDQEAGGYGSWAASHAAGVTRRQIDDWVRTGVVEPSVGTGSTRLFGTHDIVELVLIKRLLETGIELDVIRPVIAHLRSRATPELAEVTLISDGETLYECADPDEVVDLLQGHQGIFGIALGRVLREVEGALAHLRGDEGQVSTPPVSRDDEPRTRRGRQTG
jgi:DNA-binding transcriptional MerR regulator